MYTINPSIIIIPRLPPIIIPSATGEDEPPSDPYAPFIPGAVRILVHSKLERGWVPSAKVYWINGASDSLELPI